jgi:hypothetical protein
LTIKKEISASSSECRQLLFWHCVIQKCLLRFGQPWTLPGFVSANTQITFASWFPSLSWGEN